MESLFIKNAIYYKIDKTIWHRNVIVAENHAHVLIINERMLGNWEKWGLECKSNIWGVLMNVFQINSNERQHNKMFLKISLWKKIWINNDCVSIFNRVFWHTF
jgi:hypothetical protein